MKIATKNDTDVSINEYKKSTNELLIEIQGKDQKIITLYEIIMAKEKEIEELNKKVEQKNAQLSDMLTISHSKDVRIAVLENKFFEKSSRFAKRVIKKLYRVVFRREKIYIKPESAKKYKTPKYPESKKGLLKAYDSINIPKCENVLVSIIIPVYNCSSFTIGCLKSIEKTCKGMNIEVLIADDNSTDSTQYLYDNGAIRIIRNSDNLRFLKNCNNAAKYAVGKYILFLNNDTIVTENWLQSLVELIESDEKIGMVGSKFIYPNGKLQEAGGIIWKDGSAWNYGNGQDPSKPEFNYVKEADYISGASIMLSNELWKSLGGFDENFAPAYCEDSDLAFSVRKAGYKVMYQPKSVVVHFEGMSNGTDTSSGQKSYQVTNSKKFYEKWKDELYKNHYHNGEKVFQARDRSGSKKTILFIDHYVPTFDKDAGSRTVYAYLKLFVNQGFNVKFIGDNFHKAEPYTSELQKLGIEVLYGVYYRDQWKKWVEQNKDSIEYVFLNRPHISEKYIDFLRDKTNAKIIYYGHDLAFLREYREYLITGDMRHYNDSEIWKYKELELMRKSDCAYYPSEVEVEEVNEIDSAINIKAIPAYIFDDLKAKKYIFNDRKHAMFIGGFAHRPNIDAVVWLREKVMPLVWEKDPNFTVFILGSNPPDKIMRYHSDNFKIVGFVSDEELNNYYNSVRMSIVPLRYGAGIKGKVIEAMSKGVPVLTTSVGSEGILNSEKALAVADDEAEFAQMLLEIYNAKDRLEKMSAACYEYINENYTSEKVLDVIGSDFDIR